MVVKNTCKMALRDRAGLLCRVLPVFCLVCVGGRVCVCVEALGWRGASTFCEPWVLTLAVRPSTTRPGSGEMLRFPVELILDGGRLEC